MSEEDEFETYWNELPHRKPMVRGRGKRLNLVGRKFWRLLVESATGRRTASGSALWSCLCDCGEHKEVSTDNLVKGKVKSCGCLQKERGVETTGAEASARKDEESAQPATTGLTTSAPRGPA